MSNIHQSLSVKMAGLVLAQNGILAALLFYMARDAAPLALLGIAAVLIGLTCITLLFAHRMAATLKSIAGTVSRLAAGEAAALAEEEIRRDDEIGVIARHLEHISRHHLLRLIEDDEHQAEQARKADEARLRDVEAARAETKALKTVLETLDAGLRRLAVGDLTVRLSAPFPQDFEGLRGDFNHGLASIEETFGRISGTTYQLHGDCAETQKTAESTAETAARQAASIAGAAKDVATLAESLRARKMQAGHAATIAYNARMDMRRPKELMQAASDAVDEVRTTTGPIESAAAAFREIAFDANMLALNASIEASHTNDKENHFKATAEEMRKLAERAAHAATDISALARQSTEAADRASKSTGKVAGELDALAVYAQALQDQAETINTNAAKEIEAASAIRSSLATIARTSRDQIGTLDSLAARIGSLWREVGSIDHDAGRFTPVTVIAEGTFSIPESAKPPPKRGAHLRLVKS